MNVPARSLALTALLVASTPLAAAHVNDIVVDVGRGPITIHVPDSYDPAEPLPLIIALHGYSSSGASLEAWMQFEPLVNPYEFLYAAPDGTTDFLGFQFWNATDACCNFGGSNVDDSGYLRALMDAVKAQVSVDERRVYFVGHSNGGFMSYRMACDHADAVAAIASLAGATYFNTAACTPSGPVHTLQVHGTADTTILYGGGTLVGVPYPGAVETTENWATYDGCTLLPDNSAPNLDIDVTIPGDETLVTRYVDACLAGGAAELWTIAGGPHSPALTPDWARLVVEWLYAHPKPGIDATRYCDPAVTNSSGQPAQIDALGSDSLAQNDLTLRATNLPQNMSGYFLTSLSPGFVAGPGGSSGDLCLGGTIGR
ncbi:MAG: PHB depolymerase family esterase, partial [Planctomycetota bacterium]